MSRNRRLVILLGVAAFVCYGVWLCVAVATWLGGENTCSPKTPQNTEELGQFKFPPSTKNLKSSCFGMQGWGGDAEFEMVPTDLQYFVEHTQLKTPLINVGVPTDHILATKASSLKSYLHSSYHTVYQSGKTFWQDILIDTSNPSLYTVYINFSGG